VLFHDGDAGEEKNFSVCSLLALCKWKNLLVKNSVPRFEFRVAEKCAQDAGDQPVRAVPLLLQARRGIRKL
jgi:hypothetical protein